VRIALGLDVHLQAFAEEHLAQTYRDWGAGERWRDELVRIASEADTEIRWNLTEIDVVAGLTRAAARFGGPTDWELSLFHQNSDWLRRTRWYRDGVEVAQPVEFT